MNDPGPTSCSGKEQHAFFPVTVSDRKCRSALESTRWLIDLTALSEARRGTSVNMEKTEVLIFEPRYTLCQVFR